MYCNNDFNKKGIMWNEWNSCDFEDTIKQRRFQEWIKP